MLQPLTTDRVERFYKDVDTLRLKFPVAEISRATGQSKGNVSKYLSQTLEPSNAFLDRFYRAYANSFKNVSRERGVVFHDAPVDDSKPQNGQIYKTHATLTEIGELVKKIQYVTNMTIEQIADRIKFSRPHLTTLLKSGESKKALTRLKQAFAKEIAAAPELTTTTNKPVFDVKLNTPDKDITIKQLADVVKSQQDLLTETNGKLIALVSKVIEKL